MNSAKEYNIFPLWSNTRSKFLEAKDYVEIAIRYCLLNDCAMMDFICSLFYDEFAIWGMNLFPIYIYKLLVYYEKMSLFECLYEKEKVYDRIKGSNIIVDCFSYAIIIDNITIALYLLKKYRRQIEHKNETIIDAILFILNEYTEQNGSSKYHNGISHFEELMYFLYIFVNGFKSSHVHYLFRIFFSMTRLDLIEDEEFDFQFQSKIQKANEVNQTRNNFLLYSQNPFKYLILVIDLTHKLWTRFPHIDVGVKMIDQRFGAVFRIMSLKWGFNIDKIGDWLKGKFLLVLYI